VRPESVEEVWRREAPHVLHALFQRYQDFERCEDAAQEALEAALAQWPDREVPQYPRGWLIRVASRKVLDSYRRDEARAMREQLVATYERRDGTDREPCDREDVDCTLEMLLLCCHPALSAESRVILSLRAVVGLTTAQIADVFFLTEATAGQRISRAKATIRRHGGLPAPADADERLDNVLHSLYLMFTQGHTLSRGETLLDLSLSSEAIRLVRELRGTLPHDAETAGLLALMLLTEARHRARVDHAGNLVPLPEQDRDLWDREAILEGIALVEWALPNGPVGPYQIQAAIAAVHDEAPTWATTDWPQILVLYRFLARIAPSPTVRLNLAVAEAMAIGPQAALAGLDALGDGHLVGGHRYLATRAHLVEMAGRPAEAAGLFHRAALQCRSAPERRYLETKVQRLVDG
jgi:RNA polymerase sigma factor (sigma-70 family)